MSTSHLLRILVPGAALDTAVADYVHNLLVGTSLRNANPIALEQLRRLDIGKQFIAACNQPLPPSADDPEVTQREQKLEIGLRVYLDREGTATRPPAAAGSPLSENLVTLSALLDLSPREISILQFVTVSQLDGALSEFINSFGALSVPLAAALISVAIGETFQTVQAALAPNQRLVHCGLVVVVARECRGSDKVHLRWGLLNLLVTPALTREKLLARFFALAPASVLEVTDYAHLEREVRLVTDLLAGALAAHRGGINILLHGPTGAGKTELSYIVARALGVEAFLVHGHDEEGGSVTKSERLSSLRLGQALLRNGRSLLIFDEMEDLFTADRHQKGHETELFSKQWFTSFLENNEVPTLWIANSIHNVDRAYLRRFTYSIEFSELTSVRRAEVLSKCAANRATLSPNEITMLAQQYQSSPAQLASSIDAASLAGEERPGREQIEQFLSSAHKLVEGKAASSKPIFDPQTYRLDDVNCSEDLVRLTDRLMRWRPSNELGVSLCLYGPSGTGKSEYVRYLAHRMGRKVVYRHGSDITSKWVGETEKNIAGVFREAEAQDALLLFDEVDSFLRDRELGVRSWEVTQVNEFLQQLEAFRGIVACTTNLWEKIDQAALRRFVFKLEFRPMLANQAVSLFQSMFATWLGEPDASKLTDVSKALRRHCNITPGDMAAVRRKIVALDLSPSSCELLEFVCAEVSAKRAQRGLGFRSV